MQVFRRGIISAEEDAEIQGSAHRSRSREWGGSAGVASAQAGFDPCDRLAERWDLPVDGRRATATGGERSGSGWRLAA